MKLLSRDEFRESVFKRDGHKCVICGEEAKDAHHIIERRLFSDGGYYIDNGASLCAKHHIDAETTALSCEQIREAASITNVVLPEDYYSDHVYTKWGDVVLPNNQRMKGELFNDESVQKILNHGGVLGLYTDYVKYPRSYHLPWSLGKTKDDRTLQDCSCFENKEVVVTLKMDGENTSIYPDYCHARSIDGRNHWSRNWVKNLQSKIGWEIPNGWRICGENLYCKHTLKYENLDSYFYVFSIWNEKNECLGWDETVEFAKILGLAMVPELYRGIWDEEKIKEVGGNLDLTKDEGYVVRLAERFSYGAFKNSLAKFVRKEHVGTNHHWMMTATEKNTIK